MKMMNWSYEELMACPQTVFEDIILYTNTRNILTQLRKEAAGED